MNPVSHDRLLGQLRWRYATKKFDPARKIPTQTWAALEESLRLTPSSFGLQPWKFLVIADPVLREKLKAASWEQSQITEASHLVVFAVRRQNTAEVIDAFIENMAGTRGLPDGSPSLARRREGIVEFGEGRSHFEWNARQAYIALGNFLTCAALLGVDACPIEGMEAGQYDEILDLTPRNFATAVACVAGYRAPGDAYARAPKVRFERKQVVEYR